MPLLLLHLQLASVLLTTSANPVRAHQLLQVLPALAPGGRPRQPAVAGDMRVFPSLVSGATNGCCTSWIHYFFID
jgi:hypothetical protein